MLCEQTVVLLILHHSVQSLPPMLHFLFAGFLVVVEIIINLWMLLHESYHICHLINHFFTMKEKFKLFLVKSAFRTLFYEVWIHDVALYASTKNLWIKIV